MIEPSGGIEAPPSVRVATLDIVRGIAVMGILAMNIVAFAMPVAAYLNPRAYGWETSADFWSWLTSFVFIDGRMRGLFSFLFGASMLLIIERAESVGQDAARIHFARMACLLLFGLIHFYLIWFGDILALYAAMGMVAWFFRRSPPRLLILFGLCLLAIQMALFTSLAIEASRLSARAALPNASPEILNSWWRLSQDMAVPDSSSLRQSLALYRGDYWGIAHYRLTELTAEPLRSIAMFGWETLGYMLLGMAALRSGFLAGNWNDRAYAWIAGAAFAVAIPAYAFAAWMLVQANFAIPALFAWGLAATVPMRPVMIVAIAALIIRATRPGGTLVKRIAAAGRAAFTNYLGSSILMTSLFYGYGGGMFGRLSRSELWLVVVPMWGLMLLWSKPWLDRYRYGPFEWLWRSLARGAPESMRRRPESAAG